MTNPVLPRIRSEAVWNRARDAYLVGATAADVCARFGLGMSTFRARARRCGWRRADLPDPFVDDPDEQLCHLPLDDEGDAPHPVQAGVRNSGAADLRVSSWRRARRAIDAGDVLEARRWLRLMAELSELARYETHDVERLLQQQVPDGDPPDPDSADSADSNFRRGSPESRESGPSTEAAATPQSQAAWRAGIDAFVGEERARLRALRGLWD